MAAGGTCILLTFSNPLVVLDFMVLMNSLWLRFLSPGLTVKGSDKVWRDDENIQCNLQGCEDYRFEQ